MKKIFCFLLMLALCIPLIYADVDLDNKLAHVWQFSETSGNATDSIGETDTIADSIISKNNTGINGNAWDLEASSGNWIRFLDKGMPYGDQERCFVWFLKAESYGTNPGSITLLQYGTIGQNGKYFRSRFPYLGNYALSTWNTNVLPSKTGPLNNWVMVVISINTTADTDNCNMYLNYTGNGNSSFSDPINTLSDGNVLFGDVTTAGADQPFDGLIDEFYIWNRSCHQDDIQALYNNGDFFFYPFTPPPSQDLEYILKLFNRTGQLYNINNIKEGQNFYIKANITYKNTDPYTDQCNVTGKNFSAVFPYIASANATLSDPGTTFQYIIDEGTTNLLYDSFDFRVCRTGLKTPAQIYINGSLFKTINRELIPLCTIGSHFVFNSTQQYITKRNLNFSIKCSECNGGNTQLKIIKNKNNILSEYFRTFSVHTEQLTYNTTSHLHEYNPYQYTYLKPENGNITLACNDTYKNFTFFVGDVVPFINIVSINDIKYTPGMQVESNITTSILTDVISKGPFTVTVNITYQNGTLIKTSYLEAITLNSTDLNVDGIYNITITAVDETGNSSNKKGYFIVNDTVKPAITWITPRKDNSSVFEVNKTTHINISLYDVNLYAYELLIYNPANELYFNFTDIGISGPSYIIDENAVFNLTGAYRAELTVTDDHTDTNIADYNYNIKDFDEGKKGVKFDFYSFDGKKTNVSIEYRGNYENTALSLIKETDRYNFKFNYELGSDLLQKSVNHKFMVKCEGIDYLEKSGYAAHFVCWNARQWIDFETENIISYTVEECGKDCFIVNMDMVPSKDVLFKSIGGLNTQREVVRFTASVEPETPYNIDLIPNNLFNNPAFNLSTTPGVLLFFFIIFVLIALITFAEYTQIPFIMLFGGLYWFFTGILLYVTISAILGVIMTVLALIYIIRSILFTR